MRNSVRLLAPALAASVVAASPPAVHAAERSTCSPAPLRPGLRWRAAWGVAMQNSYPLGVPSDHSALLSQALPGNEAHDQTFRILVRPDPRGRLLRLRLTNRFGTRPLTLGPVRIGRTVLTTRGAPTPAVAGGGPVTFCGGRRTVVVPPGGAASSDPVARPGRGALSVSIAVPPQSGPGGGSGPIDWHAAAYRTSFVTPPGSGDRTEDSGGTALSVATSSVFLLDGIAAAVPHGSPAGTTVVLGDSITDGSEMPVDAGDRWIEVAARGFGTGPDRPALIDAGIGGNHLLPLSPAARAFGPAGGRMPIDRLRDDVLSRPGVTHLLMLEGTNDILASGRASRALVADLIAATERIVRAARSRGVSVVLGTLPPFGDHAGSSPDAELARSSFNAWIRASAARGLSDGVVDFDRAMPQVRGRDGLPAMDEPCTTDRLHPSVAGARVMAAVVVADQDLLTSPRGAPTSRVAWHGPRGSRRAVLRVRVGHSGTVAARVTRAVKRRIPGLACRRGGRRGPALSTVSWRAVARAVGHAARKVATLVLPRGLRPGRYRALIGGARDGSHPSVGVIPFTIPGPRHPARDRARRSTRSAPAARSESSS